MKRQLYLIGYDIRCNRRRRHMLKKVKGHATGGQKSLYEAWMSTSELTACLISLQNHLDIYEDKLIVIQLDARATVHTIGKAVKPADGVFFYQG